jgi:hypothetical protein
MNFIDFLAFVITMLLFIYLSARQVWGSKKRMQESYDDEELDYEEVDEDNTMPSHKTPPPPPRVPPKLKAAKSQRKDTFAEGYEFKGSLEGYRQKSVIAERKLTPSLEKRYESAYEIGDAHVDPYAIKQRAGISRGLHIVKALKSKKNAVILHEILERPRAFKENDVSSR